MPQLAYLKVEGIKGPAAFDKDPYNRQGTIPILAVTHEITSNLDPKTGRPTPSRTHGPLVVRKKIDSASPYLREMHVGGTEKNCNLMFFHMPRDGPETLYLTVTLAKARIVSYKAVMPHLMAPGMSVVHEWEEIGFIYESIDWSYKKHASDPPHGSNPGTPGSPPVQETLAAFLPDWLDEEAKALFFKNVGMLTEEAAEALLEEYRNAHPGELPE